MCRTAASRSTASSSASNKLLNYSRRETRGFLKMKGECMDILTVLEERFENNTLRHPGLDWQTASQKLQKNPDIPIRNLTLTVKELSMWNCLLRKILAGL